MTDMAIEPSYTRDELAEMLHCSASTLAKMAMTKLGPPYLRVGRKVRYPLSGVKKWLDDRLCGAPAPVQPAPAEPAKRLRGRPRLYA